MLLERETQLEALRGALDQASVGEGRVVLVPGEVGVGKTSLVHAFAEAAGEDARFLWGGCEALFTPRPLGPLHDMAAQLGGPRLGLDESPVRTAAIFEAFLEVLRDTERPTVAVFEDVHWADEATLDLIKFLGRRVERTPALLVLTYRDDEVGPAHPLRVVLGDLPRANVVRVAPLRLTEAAVRTLAARSALSPEQLFRTTGGNPFFLTEVLAAGGEDVPASIRDAVLGRTARLADSGRAIAELVSVVPGRAELSLIEAVLPDSASAIDACVAAGVLRFDERHLAFRHELARGAGGESLTPATRRALHAKVLAALQSGPAGGGRPARLVHHAAEADDAEAVLALAPEAALEAARLNAHREAAAHYATALRFGAGLPDLRRADLLEAHAYELYLTGRSNEALDSRREALEAWRRAGRAEAMGRQLRWMSRLSWFLGQQADALRYAEEAIAILEALTPGRELAWALSNRAQLHMLAEENEDAIEVGGRALELARALDADEIVVHALNNVGTARYRLDPSNGVQELEESLRLALEGDYEEHAARAWTNIGSGAAIERGYDLAVRHLDAGIAYCEEHDLDAWTLYMLGFRAQCRLDLGDWERAEVDACRALEHPGASAVLRIQALVALGTLRTRQGDASAGPLLDEALELARGTNEAQRLGPVAAARAEAAWLAGDGARAAAEVRDVLQMTIDQGNPRWIPDLEFWLWRGGAASGTPRAAAGPHRMQMLGRWKQAAAAWNALGCPYERAMALADGDVEARRAALDQLIRLGADAAAERVRHALAAEGVKGLPRGPRAATRANPAGLTPRQVEIVTLLAEGLTNAAIAERLHIAPKTAEHHVSAVLARLEAGSRAEAVEKARALGVSLETRGG